MTMPPSSRLPRKLSALAAITIMASALSACGTTTSVSGKKPADERPTVSAHKSDRASSQETAISSVSGNRIYFYLYKGNTKTALNSLPVGNSASKPYTYYVGSCRYPIFIVDRGSTLKMVAFAYDSRIGGYGALRSSGGYDLYPTGGDGYSVRTASIRIIDNKMFYYDTYSSRPNVFTCDSNGSTDYLRFLYRQ